MEPQPMVSDDGKRADEFEHAVLMQRLHYKAVSIRYYYYRALGLPRKSWGGIFSQCERGKV